MELVLKMAVKGEKDKAAMVKRVVWGMVVLLLILANFPLSPGAIKDERRNQFYPPALIDEFFSSIEWIKENTSPETVIMSSEAPWIIMLTDRKTLTWPLFEPISYVIDSLITNAVEYIVVSDIEYAIYALLNDFIKSHPQHFLRVFTNNKTSVYKIASENLRLLKDEMDITPGNKTEWQK